MIDSTQHTILCCPAPGSIPHIAAVAVSIIDNPNQEYRMRRGRKSAWDTKIAPRLEQIKAWCRDGYTDQQICDALNIHIDTFCKYKREKTELTEALKVTKEIADLTVENSLFKRATGCEVTEIIEESIYVLDSEGRARPTGTVKRRKIVKQLPPDTTAGIFWSKNRQPEKWRDKHEIEHSTANDEPIKIKWIGDDD